MAKPFVVRPLTLADVPLCVALLAASPADAPRRFRPDGLYRPDLATVVYQDCVLGRRDEWAWAIETAAGVVGMISFVPPLLEFEYWIAAKERGCGLAAAALDRIAPLIADEFGRGLARVDESNQASRRTAERAGFRLQRIVVEGDRRVLELERRAERAAA